MKKLIVCVAFMAACLWNAASAAGTAPIGYVDGSLTLTAWVSQGYEEQFNSAEIDLQRYENGVWVSVGNFVVEWETWGSSQSVDMDGYVSDSGASVSFNSGSSYYGEATITGLPAGTYRMVVIDYAEWVWIDDDYYRGDSSIWEDWQLEVIAYDP